MSKIKAVLMVVLGLGLGGAALSPGAAWGADVPWFSQRGAERLVSQAVPAYYAYLQEIRERNPERYQERLHQAMLLIAGRDGSPEVYAAWKALWDVEVRYMARLKAWQAAPEAQRTAIRAELLALSRQWEQARLDLFAVKIPTFEERLYLLEADFEDVHMNLESYAEERVMHSLAE